MYNSDFALEQRRQIAVNGRYICYALRQGQLRVLHRQSAERALLKSKGAAVTDVQCARARCCAALVAAPHSSHVRASYICSMPAHRRAAAPAACATDGTRCLWRLLGQLGPHRHFCCA